MAENNKKFERNLGKAADIRDARVQNVVEERKNAQDERLKKGRGQLTEKDKQQLLQAIINFNSKNITIIINTHFIILTL